MAGCLLMVLFPVLTGIVVALLSGDTCFGVLLGGSVGCLPVLGLIKLAERFHRRIIRCWAAERCLTVIDLYPWGAKITPGEVSRWRDWAAYEMTATSEDGKQHTFYFFLTGLALLCIRLSVSTPNDYIRVHISSEASEVESADSDPNSPIEIRLSKDDERLPIDELCRRMEDQIAVELERRKKAQSD